MPDYLEISEVADKFGVEERTVRNWIRERKIRAVKVVGQWKIKKTDLEEFEKNLPTNLNGKKKRNKK